MQEFLRAQEVEEPSEREQKSSFWDKVSTAQASFQSVGEQGNADAFSPTGINWELRHVWIKSDHQTSTWGWIEKIYEE